MAFGWTGSLLRVNLSTGETATERIPDRLLEEYIGGDALASRLLYDETRFDADPLGPENMLIFSTGPLAGTPFGGGRMSLVTRSPQTGLFLAGNIGGHLAPELKYAGYDLLLISGESPRPVYLCIEDNHAEIRDASHLWGKDTWETHDRLEKECGKETQSCYIGPAGENRVMSATLMGNRNHSGGRGGFGALMGSKRLKAIVVKGTGSVNVAQPREFAAAQDKLWNLVDPATLVDAYARPWSLYGSPSNLRAGNSNGAIATHNAQAGEFDGLTECGAEAFMTRYFVKGKACAGCRWPACGHWVQAPGEPEPLAFEGVQAGVIIAMGSMLGISDPVAIMRAHALCNRLGICFISLGTMLGWAIEACERGDLTPRDTDGLKFKWNDPETMFEFIRRVALREGPFADLMAQGLAKAAQTIGRGTDYAMTIKNAEWTQMCGNAYFPMALGYAVDDRNPSHTHFYPPYPPTPGSVPQEVLDKMEFDFGQAADRTSPEEKGKWVKWLMDSRTALNSLPFCLFLSRGRVFMDLRPVADLLTLATGVSFTHDSLMTVGERATNLVRSYNVRLGASRRDDQIPKRFLEEGFPAGGSRGVVAPLEKMLDDYYVARGWDLDTGIPSDEKLSQLGLAEVSREIQRVREEEAARPERDAEKSAREARRRSQMALYQVRMAQLTEPDSRTQPAASEAKIVKIRYCNIICQAAGGLQEEEIATQAATVGGLLLGIREKHPAVFDWMMEPSGKEIDPRRRILIQLPGGLTRAASLTSQIEKGTILTLW